MIWLFVIILSFLLFLASRKGVLAGHSFVVFASVFVLILFTVTVAYAFI